MRIMAAVVLCATFLFAGMEGHSQDPCTTEYRSKPSEKPLTGTELVHRNMLLIPFEKWRRFGFGDVEVFLRCGTQQDADEFFTALHNTSTEMPGATVLEADRDVVLVAWEGDGDNGHLGTFAFRFSSPLTMLPHPGDKIDIRGTYSSYSRMPLQINMTNSSFIFIHPAIREPIKPRQDQASN